MKRILILISTLLSVICCSNTGQDNFVRTDGTQFILDGKPYYYIGANYWAGPVLGSPGKDGDRERLAHDLDVLKEAGVTNLRVLAGADASGANNLSIIPYLQKAPGVLDEDLLEGLDYFMAEIAKRGMKAILYLNNDCPWSGGYIYYVKQVTGEDAPNFWTDGAGYRETACKFIKMRECQELYFEFLKTMVSRTNSITGVAYKDDPAIFAWQIGNEPRAMSDSLHTQFIAFMHESAQLIRSLDSNHMISTGCEGQQGCENDPGEYETVHADSLINYLTFHIWPDNWGFKDLYGDSESQLQNHIDVARKLGKPLVIEEFGLIRDGHLYEPSVPTTHRDEYYEWLFKKVLKSAEDDDLIAGANFWAFAGAGRAADDSVWEEGDDLLGDPPFEPQGLFSVFDSDTTTLNIVKNNNILISRARQKNQSANLK